MSKTTQLIKNTVIIGIGTLSTKVLTFLLLPLYTAVLAPDDYGIIDVLITISSLVIPFTTMEMSSGVFRFLIEKSKEDNGNIKSLGKISVISTGITVEGIGFCFTLVFCYIINCFITIPHFYYFSLYVISMAIAKLCLDISRGFGHNTIYSIANFIITLVSLVSNVILIIGLGWPGKSILLATILGNFCGSLFIVTKEKIWQFIDFKTVSIDSTKPIIKYTLPLIPNTVSWWVVNASDRLLILTFLGATANGIYAAANKIPGIYTTAFTVFSLAWTEAVARNIDDRAFIVSTIKKSLQIMIYMLFALMLGTSIFFNFLIGPNYAGAYWHIIILLIAIFFSSIASLYGGIFSGFMDSKIIAETTVIGAIVNVLINLLLIKVIGLYAASISTAIAYMSIAYIRKKKIQKWISIDSFSLWEKVLLMASFCVIVLGYYLKNSVINLGLLAILFLTFCFSQKEVIQKYIKVLKKVNRVMKLSKIKKHAGIISKALMYRARTSLYKKDPKLWLFGAWKGTTYNDNSKYMYEYVVNNCPSIKACWITKKRDIYEMLNNKGYPVAYYPSKEADELINKAGLLFQTEGYKDIGEFPVGRGKVIQLWHGSPGAKSMKWFEKYSKIDELFIHIESGNRKKQLWVSQSEYYSKYFHDSIGVPLDNFINTGLPRCDAIKESNSSLIRLIKEKGEFNKTVLYLPTHRNWGVDFDNNFITDGLKKMDESLNSTGICLLYKPHPNEVELFHKSQENYTNVVVLEGKNQEEQDLYSYLFECDALISDYSSVMIDYLIANKPIVLFTYDLENYKEADGGLVPEFFDKPIGPKVKTWDELINTVISLLEVDTWKSQRESVASFYCEYNSGENCRRLADYLLSKIN